MCVVRSLVMLTSLVIKMGMIRRAKKTQAAGRKVSRGQPPAFRTLPVLAPRTPVQSAFHLGPAHCELWTVLFLSGPLAYILPFLH